MTHTSEHDQRRNALLAKAVKAGKLVNGSEGVPHGVRLVRQRPRCRLSASSTIWQSPLYQPGHLAPKLPLHRRSTRPTGCRALSVRVSRRPTAVSTSPSPASMTECPQFADKE